MNRQLSTIFFQFFCILFFLKVTIILVSQFRIKKKKMKRTDKHKKQKEKKETGLLNRSLPYAITKGLN